MSIIPALPYSITIPKEERSYLLTLIKTRTIQALVVDRARMLLWKSEGKTDKSIAEGLGVSVNTVRRCVDRYETMASKVSQKDEYQTLQNQVLS